MIITLKSEKNLISKGLCSPCENSRTEKLVAFEADCNYYLYPDDDDDDDNDNDDDDDSNADDEDNNFYDDDDDDEDDENNNSFTSKSLITLF